MIIDWKWNITGEGGNDRLLVQGNKAKKQKSRQHSENLHVLLRNHLNPWVFDNIKFTEDRKQISQEIEKVETVLMTDDK